MNTQAILYDIQHDVTSTHTIVSEIHCTMMKGREGNNDENQLVSDTRNQFITE